MLYKEVETRKKRFSDFGGDYQSYARQSGKDMPSIETYEDKEEAVAFLTREGIRSGIYFVVTAVNTGAIRYKILQNFKQIFVLQLNDKMIQ